MDNISNMTYGKDFRKKNLPMEGKYPVYGANGIIGHHNKFTNENASLIIGCRGSVGNTLISHYPCFITHNSLIIEPHDTIDLRYLKYSIDAEDKTNTITGTSQPQITIANLKKLKIKLAPQNEQKRIVEKLDKLFLIVELAQARLDKIPAIFKKFRQSALHSAVTGELTKEWREGNKDVEHAKTLLIKAKIDREKEYKMVCDIAKKKGERKPKKPENLFPECINKVDETLPIGWASANLKDICSTKRYAMTSGPFGSSLGTKDYIESGISVIRGQNIQPSNFKSSNFVYISEIKAKELERSQTSPGDIVIVAVGAGVGNSSIIPDSIKKAVLSQNCNKFSIDAKVAYNKFILAALQISNIRSQMEDSTTDTARQFLSLTNLKKIIFPLPPLEEQKEIVRRIDQLFKKVDQIEARYNKAKQFTNKLSQSILAKAFRGELAPQDPNDEPAEKLLERIKKERGSQTKAKNKSRKER